MAMVMLAVVAVTLGIFPVSVFAFAASAFFASFTCSVFGVLIAVGVREVFEAQTLLNFFRFPMIFLSGCFLPIAMLPTPLLVLSLLLPLTYALELLRYSLTGAPSLIIVPLSSLVLFIYVLALYAAAVLILRSRFR
jgi:ABC-2 type transport system permease protein